MLCCIIFTLYFNLHRNDLCMRAPLKAWQPDSWPSLTFANHRSTGTMGLMPFTSHNHGNVRDVPATVFFFSILPAAPVPLKTQLALPPVWMDRSEQPPWRVSASIHSSHWRNDETVFHRWPLKWLKNTTFYQQMAPELHVLSRKNCWIGWLCCRCRSRCTVEVVKLSTSLSFPFRRWHSVTVHTTGLSIIIPLIYTPTGTFWSIINICYRLKLQYPKLFIVDEKLKCELDTFAHKSAYITKF